MDTKKLLISFLILVFCVIAMNANNKNAKASFVGNAVITDVETSLSFYISEEFSSVYVYVSDAEKNVFQKVKVYQRGNGKIICDKNHLEPGTYYYTMFVDGEEVDTQKLEVKKKTITSSIKLLKPTLRRWVFCFINVLIFLIK